VFNGLNNGLADLSRLSSAKTRSVSPENFSGAKGAGGMAEAGAEGPARELGKGWKVSTCVTIKAGETFTLCDIEGPGAVQHIWMTPTGNRRHEILRVYWDGSELPSVECPIGDFFACAFQEPFRQLSSLAVCVNPGSAFNCYWQMPFRKRCRMTFSNISTEDMVLFYQIDYTLTEIPDDRAYFHAQFRRVNPLPYKEVYTILDNVTAKGHYAGTYMAWGVNNNGWWGEGEVKFYLDGDREYPTICGTGLEDYFCGSYNFDVEGRYAEYCTPYSGLANVVKPDGLYRSQQRFSMYRWHIADPVRFDSEIRVTAQALGWRSGGRYLPLRDDIASVAYWYQELPVNPFPPLPDADGLEII
jgi:hypothetical protein